MALSKKHNAEVNLLKFLFAFVILVYHGYLMNCEADTMLLRYGYTGTEFFFLVSGYLMAHSALRYDATRLGQSTWQFVLGKVKVFYPYLLVAFVFTFIVRQYIFSTAGSIRVSWATDLLLSSNELLLLQTSGVGFDTLFNGPSWYLSAMTLAMALLFPLLLKCREWFVNIGSGLLAVLTYAFIGGTYSHLNVTRQWLLIMESGLLRAIAGVALGVFAYGLVARIKEKGVTLRPAGKVLLYIAELAMLAIILLIMQFRNGMKGTTRFDFVVVLLELFLCVTVFSELTGVGQRLPQGLCAVLGRMSLPLYLNQRGLIYLYNCFEFELPYPTALMILVGATLLSVPLTEGILWLCRRLKAAVWPRVKRTLCEVSSDG